MVLNVVCTPLKPADPGRDIMTILQNPPPQPHKGLIHILKLMQVQSRIESMEGSEPFPWAEMHRTQWPRERSGPVCVMGELS